MKTERFLIYVPILHSYGDMGTLADSVPRHADYDRLVGGYWDAVAAEFRAMRRQWRQIRVYQDGLPDARPDIVARIVAEVDSPNYRLVRWLAGREAVVTGTEDPVLLQEEYELVKASVTDELARHAYVSRAAGLLESRDRYIAARIGDTLPPEGTGVLFIGLQHHAVEFLPADITVSTLRCSRELLPGIAEKLGIARAAPDGLR